ncbi:PAS domain-containing protein, partial [Candidatus Margulisiibacteriota bacterium]
MQKKIIAGIKENIENELKSLQKRNSFLNNIIGSLTHPFMVINTDDYKIILTNSSVLQEQLPNQTCYEFSHKNNKPCKDKEHPCPIETIKQTKKPITVEHIHYDKDGNIHNIQINAYPIFNEEGNIKHIIEYILDITEYKKMEESLAKTENRYKEIINNTSTGFAIYKAINNGEDFIFVDFNQASEKIDSIKKSDLINKSVCDVFPGVIDFGLFDVFKRVYKTGKPEFHPINIYKDHRIEGYRENYVYKLQTGEIVAIYTDETPRKKAEEALRISEENHRLLVQSIPDIVYRIDKNGIFTFLNNSVSFLGYKPEELIGNHFSVLLHPDDIKKVSRSYVLPKLKGQKTGGKDSPGLFDERRFIDEKSGEDRSTKGLEIRLIPKEKSKQSSINGEIISSGHHLYSEVDAAGQYGADARTDNKIFLGTVGVIRNITERKKMENTISQQHKHEKLRAELWKTANNMELSEKELLEELFAILIQEFNFDLIFFGQVQGKKIVSSIENKKENIPSSLGTNMPITISNY